MGRKVLPEVEQRVLELLQNGTAQRDIHRITGASREYVRALAKRLGVEWKVNGRDIKGIPKNCQTCGIFYYRSPSKVSRAEYSFCSEECKRTFFRGQFHPNYISGKFVGNNFSDWLTNQGSYKKWRKAVLAKYNNTCVITGLKEDLEAHHVCQKAENFSPEESLNPDNGICVNKNIHIRLHQISKAAGRGITLQADIDQVKKEFADGSLKIKSFKKEIDTKESIDGK